MNKSKAFTRLEDALKWIAENAAFREHHLAMETEVMALRSEVAELRAREVAAASEASAKRADDRRRENEK
jgi:hypothetical protein